MEVTSRSSPGEREKGQDNADLLTARGLARGEDDDELESGLTSGLKVTLGEAGFGNFTENCFHISAVSGIKLFQSIS